MSLFENLSKKVSETAKAAAKKSGDIVEVTKLNMSVGTEEGKIEKTYNEIGKIVYNSYSKGEEVPLEFKELCDKIKSYEENIRQIKEKILEIKNTKMCSSCGNELELDIVFCPKCGAKQEISKPAVEEPAPAEIFCPSCGALNLPDGKFCGKCGHKLQ